MVFGDGEQIRDYVYSIDLVKGILAALESEVAGVYQLGTGIPTTLNSLIEDIRQVVGPQFDFKVSYKPARSGEIINTYCDISKAKNAFNYSVPTSLLQGLSASWEWFLNQEAK